MKFLSKRNLFIGAFLIVVLVIGSFIFLARKKIFIIGFAYKNETIYVRQSKITLQTVKVNTDLVDSDHDFSFYKVFHYYTLTGDVTLNIEIDSADHKLLDTMITITKSNDAPFISFEKPTETKSKRKFFMVDEADGWYIKN